MVDYLTSTIASDFYWSCTPIDLSATIRSLDRVANHRNVGANFIDELTNSPLFSWLSQSRVLCPFYHHSWLNQNIQNARTNLNTSMIWGSRRRSSSLWHVKCWATECTSLVSQRLLLEAAKSDWLGYRVAMCCPPPINRFFLETLLIEKHNSLILPWNSSQIKKRSNCDYAQPTWLFAHHLVMKHSELSLTTIYHPVNDDRSKSKHGQHPKPFNLFNTCWWFVGWGCHYQR